MICTARPLRKLAIALAAEGFFVLRFDYHGVGDSLGSDSDPGRVASWKESIARACDEAKLRSGASRLHVFGVRLGALLAPFVTCERNDVASLVLWAPVTRGRAFVRELQAFNAMSAGAEWAVKESAEALGPGDAEAGGFLLTRETIADLGVVDLLKLERKPAARMLLIGRDELPLEERLVDHFGALGAVVERKQALGYAGMMTSRHNATVPVKVIDQVRDWLVSIEPAIEPAIAPQARSSDASLRPATTSDAAHTFTETAQHFGPDDRLFGVITRPTAPGVERPAIVMLTIGANPHYGSNGMYVRWARKFASLGFSSLRYDVSGIGESEPASGEAEIQPYPKAAAADVSAALALLRAQGHTRFVLIGLCSGGYHAFNAALSDASVVGTMIINAQTFDYREGDTLDVTRAHWQAATAAAQYKRSLFSLEKWRKLISGRVNVREVLGVVRTRVVSVVEARLARLVTRPSDPARRAFAGDFKKLCDRGTDVFMVFATNDPGLDYLRLHAKPEIDALAGHSHFGFVEMNGPDHTFTPRWSQVELEQRVTERLTTRWG